MGHITAIYMKFETGTRGGLHAHGQVTQPVLHTQTLKARLQDGVFASHLYDFFESFMCCFFPVPNVATIGTPRERDNACYRPRGMFPSREYPIFVLRLFYILLS